MPMIRALYPDNWEEISRRIRFERAGGKCENCGAPHGEVITRISGTDIWWPAGVDDWHHIQQHEDKITNYDDLRDVKVVLTCAHLGVDHPDGTPGDKHDKMDVRDENLAAYCQRCHLIYDMDEHVENRRKTMARRRHESEQDAGQLTLWGE